MIAYNTPRILTTIAMDAPPSELSSLLLIVSMHAASLIGVGLLYSWYGYPFLKRLPLRHALIILTLPQLIRHVGWVWAVPGVVVGHAPRWYAWWIVWTDAFMLVMAIVTLVSLRSSTTMARYLVVGLHALGLFLYVFNLIYWIRLGISPLVGAQLNVVAFVLPVMEISHYLGLFMALKNWRKLDQISALSNSPVSFATLS